MRVLSPHAKPSPGERVIRLRISVPEGFMESPIIDVKVTNMLCEVEQVAP